MEFVAILSSARHKSPRSHSTLGLDDLAGLDAAGAYADALAATIHLRTDRAQIHVPAAAGLIVGVGDVVAELRPFAAQIAFSCHGDAPISRKNRGGCGRPFPASIRGGGLPAHAPRSLQRSLDHTMRPVSIHVRSAHECGTENRLTRYG